MKKKIFGLFIIASLAFTLTSAASGINSKDCGIEDSPAPGCICKNGYWLCP